MKVLPQMPLTEFPLSFQELLEHCHPNHLDMPVLTLQVSEASHSTSSGTHIPMMPDTNNNITIQVEHIVKGESGGFSNKIRPFSGNALRNGKSDLEEWSKHMELILDDEHLSEKGKRHKLLESLHSLALDLVQRLGDRSIYDLFKELENLLIYQRWCSSSARLLN